MAKASEKIKDVYGDDLAKATKPREKASLAKQLLAAAKASEKDDATRLALLKMASELAADADDPLLAMEAVKEIVRRFQPDGPSDATAQIERGNALWKKAEMAGADSRLRLQLQAAEWYLRAAGRNGA